MKVLDILNERASSVLYHAAPFTNALEMLSQNTVRGLSGKDDAKHEISFTRSVTGSYHIQNKMICVIFEFNGDKLNQKYKGKAVGTEDVDWDTNKPVHRGRDNKQLEDRIYAFGGIKNAIDYIKSAIMFAPAEFIENQDANEFDEPYTEGLSNIPKIIELLSKHNIPVRFVTSEKGLYDRRSNDEAGFYKTLEKIEDGHYEKIKEKSWTVYLTFGETLQDGEIDIQSGTNVSYSGHEKKITARNEKEAKSQGMKMVAALNKQIPKELLGNNEWFFDDVEEDD